jgi:hypothetical protein
LSPGVSGGDAAEHGDGRGMLYNRQIRPFPFLRNPNAVFSGAPVIHR